MRVLLHSHFPAGHAYPMQAVAQSLIDRGHEVVWLTSSAHESRVKASGATFAATKAIASVDAALIQHNITGLFEKDCCHLESRLIAQVADYRSVLASFPADVLLVDVFPHGARALYDLGEIGVYATLGVIPFYTSGAGAPMPGSGDQPSVSWLARIETALRHLINQWAVLPILFQPVINRQRSILGLKGLPYGEPPECFMYSPYLHIQASCPTLEFSQLPQPQNLRHSIAYVGPLVSSSTGISTQLPSWWNRVLSHDKVIGITQGTFAMDPSSLIIPAIEAFENDTEVLMIVISPHADAIRDQAEDSDNVLYANWLPYHLLLPRLVLLITNGGYGSITQALSHGVPLLCAGQTEDKKDTAARVAWSGAGIDLKTDSPSPDQVRIAAQRILHTLTYKSRADFLKKELDGLAGGEAACNLLEKLACRIQNSKSQ